MKSSERERAILLSFFLPLARRTCGELRVGDERIAAYLAEVLTEFSRTDRLYRLPAPDGRCLSSIVEMLGFDVAERGAGEERRITQYVGDFALFMSGLFRPFVERGGYLGYYLEEGARAYARMAANTVGASGGEPLLFAELSRRFELYAGALDYLRKVRFPGLTGPDPVRAFLTEIERVVGSPSRN